MLNSSLSMQRNSEQDNGHSSDLDRRKSGTLLVKTVHKDNGTTSLSWWCLNSQKADTQSFEPRVHCPEVSSRAKAVENCPSTIVPTRTQLQLFFAQLLLYISSVFTEQSQKCVKNMNPITRGNPLWEDSRVLRSCQMWSTPNVVLNNVDPTHKELLLQRYGERIEKLSQKDNLSKFCTDAGFLNVVEIGQYFMTKDTAEFSQFTIAVACREYTLPRDEDTSEPKGWIRVNTKIGPVLEVATCCLHGKYGVEIRIMSVNKDNSHSWVRVYHGLNKLVTDLKNNEQETSEMQFEEYALRLNTGDCASRSKAKAKPQKRDSAGSSTRTFPIGERTWTDVEPWEYSISDYPVSKKLIHLLRHGSLPREDDGAIEFWRIKDDLQKHIFYCHHWSDEKWKKPMAKGGGNKKIFQYCSDSSGTILYLRALQGHSGRSLIDPSLQDNVIFPDGFFKYIHHFGCAIKLHSIINSGLILGGQKFEQRQTDSILSACGSHGQKP